MKQKYNLIELLIIFMMLIIILSPLYFSFINAFKSTSNITMNFLAWPDPWYLNNFKRLINDGIVKYFMNSIFITIASNFLITVFIPLAAFAIERNMNKHKLIKCLYFLMTIGIFIPFQVLMVPLTNLAVKLNLHNPIGLVLLYFTLAIPQTLFIYVNYLRISIPKELDEAAAMDGSSVLQTYIKIIFPVMKPAHATNLILNILWIWNDFQLPLLILNRNSDYWTLPLFQFNYQSQYFSDYGPSFASYFIGMLVVVVFYLIFQRKIIDGMNQGINK